MRKHLLTKAMLLLCALVAGSGSAWADDVTFTVASASSVNTSGTLPTGASVSFTNTYTNTKEQMTGGNSQTLTLTGMSGYRITKIVLSMKSNKSAGAGKLSYSTDDGTNYTYLVGTSSTGVAFNDNAWNGSYTQTYTDVTKNVSIECGTSNVIIKIEATTNSLFCQSYTITYESASNPSISVDDQTPGADGAVNNFTYILSNPVDGATVEATTSNDWISEISVNEGTKTVTYTTSNNETGAARLGIITLAYKKGGESLATKAVTITQAKKVITRNYSLATSITPGRHYIITSGKADGYVKAMGYQDTNNRKTADITVADNKTSFTTDDGVYEFVIEGDVTTGYYTIFDIAENGYLYAASSNSNYLKTQDALDDNGKWTIVIDAETDEATITAQGTNKRNVMRFNSTLFSCYSSGQSPVYLFERDADASTQSVNINLNAACTDGSKYYGTYSSPFAFVVPADLTVSGLTVSDKKIVRNDFAEGDVVPANAGVLVSSTASGDHTVALTSAAGSDKAGNLLRGTGTGITADAMDDETDCMFYRLTVHDGVVGFWWGAADGAAFAVAANKAYLAVPTAQTANTIGFTFGDESTGISNLDANLNANNAGVYNLQGQRVSGNQKGLLIKNGRKFIVK